jgi:hypothetical protein
MPLAELLAKAESDFEERWKAGQARRLLLLDPRLPHRLFRIRRKRRKRRRRRTATDAPPPTPPFPLPPGDHAPVSWSPRR